MQGRFHSYSTDTNERRLINVYLIILCILLTYLIDFVLKTFNIILPWWTSAPGIMGLYGLLYLIFKKILWKVHFIRILLRISTPNWNNTYFCKLKSSYDNFSKEKDFKISILQDWDTISVIIETDTSTGISLSGSFLLHNSVNPVLTFNYLNEPKMHSVDTMHMHYGISSIWFESGKIKGEYFTGRDRTTYGNFIEA